jgi:hypothetical protein
MRLHIERLPAETFYFAEHALEAGLVCVGFVFRDPKTKEIQLVFEKESKRLTESEARQLMKPSVG